MLSLSPTMMQTQAKITKWTHKTGTRWTTQTCKTILTRQIYKTGSMRWAHKAEAKTTKQTNKAKISAYTAASMVALTWNPNAAHLGSHAMSGPISDITYKLNLKRAVMVVGLGTMKVNIWVKTRWKHLLQVNVLKLFNTTSWCIKKSPGAYLVPHYRSYMITAGFGKQAHNLPRRQRQANLMWSSTHVLQWWLDSWTSI